MHMQDIKACVAIDSLPPFLPPFLPPSIPRDKDDAVDIVPPDDPGLPNGERACAREREGEEERKKGKRSWAKRMHDLPGQLFVQV